MRQGHFAEQHSILKMNKIQFNQNLLANLYSDDIYIRNGVYIILIKQENQKAMEISMLTGLNQIDSLSNNDIVQVEQLQTQNKEPNSSDKNKNFDETSIHNLRAANPNIIKNKESEPLNSNSMNTLSNETKNKELETETEKSIQYGKFQIKQLSNNDKQNQNIKKEIKNDKQKQMLVPHQIQRFWSFPQSLDSPMPKITQHNKSQKQEQTGQNYQITVTQTKQQPFAHCQAEQLKFDAQKKNCQQKRIKQEEKQSSKFSSNLYAGLTNVANSAKQSLAIAADKTMKVISKLIKDEEEYDQQEELSSGESSHPSELLSSEKMKKSGKSIKQNKQNKQQQEMIRNIQSSANLYKNFKKNQKASGNESERALKEVLQGEDEVQRYQPPKYNYMIVA